MLTKYVQRGHAVYVFVASDGSLGGDPELRRREQKEAARILGVREIFWGDYRDTEVPLTREMIVRLEGVIRKVEPRMIFVNSPDDTRSEERRVGKESRQRRGADRENKRDKKEKRNRMAAKTGRRKSRDTQ